MRVFKQKILFTAEECNSIINRYNNLPISYQESRDNCSYTSISIDKTENRWILDRVIKWVESELNCSIDWDSSTDEDEFYFQFYKKGDRFDKHDDNVYNRVYTAGILLNDEFEGGKFLVDVSVDNPILFENQIGNCYVIESMLKHEVTEIISGYRNVVIIFFKQSQIKFNGISTGLLKII